VSLLLAALLGSSLGGELQESGLLGLVLLGRRHPLVVGSESVEGLAATTANITISVISHVCGRWALRALLLEFLDLSVGLNVEVVKSLLAALQVLVLDDLGCGEDFLLALTLATLGVNKSTDSALVGEAGREERHLILKLGSSEDHAVNRVLNSVLNL